jgi:branched-chain amino acid aminotransferase
VGFEKSKWVWMNGQLVPWDRANLHVSAHALHYGTAVFEGIRCYATDHGAAIFRLREHLARMYASAAVYGIEIPSTPAQLCEACCAVVRRNGFDSCYVRPICYFGSATLGLVPDPCPPQLAVLAWPWGLLHGAESLEKGVRITVSPWLKFDSRMMPATAKASGQYLNSILAVRDAKKRGFDEAVLLSVDGFITEGPGENLFIVKDGKVFTNDERQPILMGITRQSVLELARDLGIEVVIGDLRLEDLRSADEAFFTGTAAEVAPIRQIDDVTIGAGVRGPVTTKLQSAFAAVTQGRDPKHQDWLHRVGVDK